VIALRRRRRSAATYKLCSLMLSYPDEELLDARRELSGAVGELPASPARSALERFCGWWAGEASLTLQQHYVQTFDLDKRCGLYLTFYGEGERRERGQALLRLKRLYRTAGLPLEGTELPDYLPVMLEFAAAATPEQAALVLSEQRAAIELIRLSLAERQSPYAHLLDAVCVQLVGLSAADRMGLEKLIAQGPPHELVGLEPFAPPEVMPTTGARR
jgi:nitrate reductase delta subunit